MDSLLSKDEFCSDQNIVGFVASTFPQFSLLIGTNGFRVHAIIPILFLNMQLFSVAEMVYCEV